MFSPSAARVFPLVFFALEFGIVEPLSALTCEVHVDLCQNIFLSISSLKSDAFGNARIGLAIVADKGEDPMSPRGLDPGPDSSCGIAFTRVEYVSLRECH